MEGYRINPDKEYVDKIINGVFAKGGYCPCGECHCKLWVKKEENVND